VADAAEVLNVTGAGSACPQSYQQSHDLKKVLKGTGTNLIGNEIASTS